MNYLLGIYLLILSGCGNSVSQNPFSYQVSPSQNTFVVTLASNPTTGYQWLIQQYDETLLTLTSSQYVPPNTKVMGAPGQIVFNFAVKSGVTRPKNSIIQFVYRRPWEPQTGTEKTVTIHFLSQ